MAAAAIFAALVAAVTYVSAVLIPASSGGFFNIGEVLIYVAAILLGPFIGLIAGAGAVIADMLIAPAYAPATFTIKALEGFLVGCLMKRLNRKIKSLTLCATIAILIGGAEMVAGYFIYETSMWGPSTAVVNLPFNIIQMVTGLIIAVPIMLTVLRVFPQLKNYL
jgi:uncharacterized membrane protein